MGFGNIIDIFVSSIFVASFFIYGGSKFFLPKFKFNFKILLAIFLLTIFVTINYLSLDNMMKTSILYLTVLISYRIVYNKSIMQCAVASFVSYLGLAIGEVLFIGVILILNYFEILSGINDFNADILANLIISLFASLVVMIAYKPIKKVLIKIKDNNKITLIITFTILLTAFCVLFYKFYFHEYKLDNYLAFNLVLAIALSYIALVVVKQQYDKSKLSEEYEKYVEYSKHSEKLVDQYSINQHENKNELIIIKSMVHKNNKELLEYLDEIISSKDNIDDAWIRYLRYLPFGGLKGIIHNKISEMKDKGINVFLNISKKVGNSKLKELTIKQNNQLSKIIGVFLDNAREAALLSDDKEVSVCVYVENEAEIIFEISNTYVNDVDLSKIYSVRNSSKGKGRGYGLSLVESIITENKLFKNEAKKVDKYFIQILKVII